MHDDLIDHVEGEDGDETSCISKSHNRYADCAYPSSGPAIRFPERPNPEAEIRYMLYHPDMQRRSTSSLTRNPCHWNQQPVANRVALSPSAVTSLSSCR